MAVASCEIHRPGVVHHFADKTDGHVGLMWSCQLPLLVQEMSAVTAACMAIKRDRFEDVCGFDESLAVASNDVDLCLRLSRKGYRNVWTLNAELYHHESLTRGSDTAPAKRRRFEGECDAMRARWGDMLLNDPYYHPALSLVQGDFITYSSPRN
ncbi:glycosyltransferase family 2 protein [Candidatus Mycobacterium methanotrophicum]|uniref:Glycosyltransferase 2-like domain-containing protein n=1 Tax=Candidatus Mycobacterium methanotrophicum TaxID=2943498 RepID=A0ABY4QL88_9MYCO|nr:hypothetical protein [Candidatus Mycobacterium methanotrophicum]UQX10569.1 hypothetical protein M5I08_21365 [Candidatus Mycobacterium methanotrophicum]